MLRVMLDARLQIHPDDNPKKSAQFRHGEILCDAPAAFKLCVSVLGRLPAKRWKSFKVRMA
jgi:hypothetical protein